MMGSIGLGCLSTVAKVRKSLVSPKAPKSMAIVCLYTLSASDELDHNPQKFMLQ